MIYAVRAGGLMYYGGQFHYSASEGVHVLRDVRTIAKAYNVARTASVAYAMEHENVLLGGTFQVTKIEPPEWWDRTQAEAQAAANGGS